MIINSSFGARDKSSLVRPWLKLKLGYKIRFKEVFSVHVTLTIQDSRKYYR
jgi:hypothetical protein